MNKNTLATVVIAGSLFATPLFASNFLHKLMHDGQSELLAANLHAKPLAKHKKQNYTDFSGTWTGNCTWSNGEESSETITIKNDDIHFNIDGQEYSIGPLQTQTISNAMSTTFDHTSLEWSDDRSTLVMKGLYYGKGHSRQDEPVITVIAQFTFSLSNEQLVMTAQAKPFIDMKQAKLSDITCALDKE